MDETNSTGTDTDRGREKAGYHHGNLRSALLIAAEAELAEKGVEGFTLRGVAKRAGVSHAAPAHHFRDTRDLLTALACVASERFIRTMRDRQARAADTPRARFVASGLGYVEFAVADPAMFELMFGSKRPDFDDPEFSRLSGEAFAILVDGVAGVRGTAPLESVDGRTAVAAAWSLVHGVANLLIAKRMKFLEGDFDRDFEATLTALVSRIVPD